MPNEQPQSGGREHRQGDGAEVIPLRGCSPIGDAPIVPIAVASDDRPTPPGQRRTGAPWPLFLLGSIAVHLGVLAAFGRAPHPIQTAGIPAIAVEIVIGDNSAAGLANTPAREEAVEVEPIDSERAVEPELAESTIAAEAEPLPALDAAESASKDPVPSSEVEQADVKPSPSLPAQELSVLAPDLQSAFEQKPEQTPKADRPGAVRQKVRKVSPAPVAKPQRKKRTPATAPSTAGGVGRGGSTGNANYRGRVAAHLARHKRFPPDARRRGAHGSTGVEFTIDGRGRVTAVRIVRSSGFSTLDRATEAMVWRASPFPAPSDRRPQRFSVPVSYSIR